jgi:uncharacterized membrane protein YqaE (UPF0057 family)
VGLFEDYVSIKPKTFMKTKNLVRIIFSLAVISLYSCNKPQVGFFHNTYKPYVKHEKPVKDNAAEETFIVKNNLSKPEEKIIKQEGSAVIDNPVGFSKQPSVSESKTKTEEPVLSADKLTTQEKRAIKKDIRAELKKLKSNDTEINAILLVIIAILLPPVAVLLVDGLSGPFWLSILLTLLFYLPGLIYALYRIFKD